MGMSTHVRAGTVQEISVPSQFFCERNTALKNSLLKKEKKKELSLIHI